MFRPIALLLTFLIGALLPRIASAQNLLWLDQIPAQSNEKSDAANLSSTQGATASTPIAACITVPAGTHVLMKLQSPLHTTSGTEGSGVYLETLYPVILGDHIVVPAHSHVQGVVERNQRAGHLERTSEFKFHFTSIIFPNNHVAAIDGVLLSIPGSKNTRSTNRDGTIHTVDQTEQVVIPAAGGGAAGAILGSVRRTGVGTFVGAGLGAGLGLMTALIKRGDDINLPTGTNVEMMLRSPLTLEAEQAAFNAQYVPPVQPANVASIEEEIRALQAKADEGRRESARRYRHNPSMFDLLWLMR